jgi:predicted transposase/invertase (TIGR01784 family)
MLQTRDDTVEEVVQFIDEVQYQSLVEEIMTTAERLEKRGELRGELKGKLETVRLMIEKGYPISEIIEITGLTESQLKENGLL